MRGAGCTRARLRSRQRCTVNQGNDYCEAPLRGASTEAPTIWLIADPQSRTSNEPGVAAAPEVSPGFRLLCRRRDSTVQLRLLQTPGPSTATSFRASLKAPSAIRAAGQDDTGVIIGNGMLVQVINVPNPPPPLVPRTRPCSSNPISTMPPLTARLCLDRTQVGGQNTAPSTVPTGRGSLPIPAAMVRDTQPDCGKRRSWPAARPRRRFDQHRHGGERLAEVRPVRLAFRNRAVRSRCVRLYCKRSECRPVRLDHLISIGIPRPTTAPAA